MPKGPMNPFAIFIGLFAVVSFLVRGALVGDPGFGWHLQNGALIFSQRFIPSVDPFLYTPDLSRPWINNQWLADIIFYLSFVTGGWRGVHLLTISLGLAVICPIFLILLDRANQEGREVKLVASICACLLAFFCVSVQWFSRPVQFSVLGFSILYSFVQSDVRWRERVERPLCMLLTAIGFCLWANLHPGFVFGLVLLYLRAAADILPFRTGKIQLRTQRREILLAIVATLATLINPAGIDLHRGIFQLIGDPFYQHLNAEWLPPSISITLFWPYYISVALLVAAVIAFRSALQWSNFETLALLIFGVFSFVSRRYIPFFGVVALLPLARALTLFSTSLRTRLAARKLYASLLNQDLTGGMVAQSLCCVIAVYVGISISIGLTGKIFTHGEGELAPETIFPGALVQYISKHKELTKSENRCVFNSPNVGGYLTWRLWPHFSAVVDDRNELNGHAAYTTYFTVRRNEPGAEEILRQTSCHFAVMEEETSEIPFIAAGWRRVSCEKKFCLFEQS